MYVCVARHIGTAIGLSTVIRAVPHHVRVQQRSLPDDVMSRVGMTDGDWLMVGEKDAANDKLCAAIFEIACVAHAHLQKARDMLPQLPSDAAAALLPAVRRCPPCLATDGAHRRRVVQVPARRYLDQLQAADFNLSHPTLRSTTNTLGLQKDLLAAVFYNNF